MYQDSPYSAACGQEDFEMDEENDDYLDDERDLDDQDESDEGTHLLFTLNVCKELYIFFLLILICLLFSDTEEASETDMGKSEEYTEIKEQLVKIFLYYFYV